MHHTSTPSTCTSTRTALSFTPHGQYFIVYCTQAPIFGFDLKSETVNNKRSYLSMLQPVRVEQNRRTVHLIISYK
jgi:hypothetical protein